MPCERTEDLRRHIIDDGDPAMRHLLLCSLGLALITEEAAAPAG